MPSTARSGIRRRRPPRPAHICGPLTPFSALPHSGRQIYLLIVLCFSSLVAASWVSEYYDPVRALIYGEPTDSNFLEAAAESFWLLTTMFILLVATRLILARLRYLEGLLHMCSFCKSISIDDEWIAFEQYLQQYSRLRLSHSLCPDCASRHYGYTEEQRLEDEAADRQRSGAAATEKAVSAASKP
ncbi:hypothetical protein IT575_06390 [bacterium]|nr:hypothetical protein [bacterium]